MSAALSPETLYRDYRDKVERYIRSRVPSEWDREDLVSQVFLNVVAAMDGYDPSRAAPGTWIYAITRNTVIDFFRIKGREPDWAGEEEQENLSAPGDVEERFLTQETLETLAAALEQLPERERAIIVLRFYHGLSAQETAQKVGVSYSNVRFLQYSALKKLSHMLDGTVLF